ncbi:MAG: AMP-binding protein [Candidatus Omnitrophica bacterium]|nr:AMP-binding protein [Candidatus Omnitrophota bacterium]
MDVTKLLSNAAGNSPDKSALIFADQLISFSQLKDLTFRLANGLKGLGLRKNTNVAVFLPNGPEYVLSYLAIYCLGGIVVPFDFMFTQDELANLIDHCQVGILIAKEKKDIDLKKLKQNSNLEKIILLDGDQGSLNLKSLIKENFPTDPQIEISDSDHSTIFYTSGSTGHPKGVLLNYRHLDGLVKAMEYFIPLSSEDTILSPIPLSHAAGLVFLMAMLSFQLTLILQERFIPLESLRIIERYKVSFICLVPSMYIALLSLKEFKNFDLRSLRYVTVFGAPSSPVLLRRFHQACPQAYLLNGWGMTETSPPNLVLPLGSKKIESIGKPAPWTEIKIFNQEGKEVPAGQIGELVIRGWVVMEGYYREPELTRQAIRDGWFYTGDLARKDEEGLFYIVGRKKEMIKVAGELVYSPEVEEVIHRHPKISEVAVVGVADQLRGEVPKAFLILNQGEKMAEDELRYFCRQHLAHFKIPHYFEFRDSLPKTRSGKIDKASLMSR